MKIVKLGEKIDEQIVLCLGFFGSMHLGHIELLNNAKEKAKETGCKVTLFTFSNNHLAVLKREFKLFYTYEERLSLYESLGVDYLITAVFDDAFKSLSGSNFLSRLKQYNLQGIFCGFDYSCGSDRLDASGIQDALDDVPVRIVDKVSVNGDKVSTTLLRDCLTNNRIEYVNALLSEPFFVTGKVVKGRGVGRKLGFPTANIAVSAEKLLPKGVFASTIRIDGVKYKAIVNIGSVPTFDIDCGSVEAHVIDFKGNLYGKEVKLSLLKYLRPITKFVSARELVAQLQRDREEALND